MRDDGYTRFVGWCPRCGGELYAWASNGLVLCTKCSYSEKDAAPEIFDNSHWD